MKRTASRHAVAAALSAGMLALGATRATAIYVTTTFDDVTNNGNCTLREAVISANTNTDVDACYGAAFSDYIQVPAGTYTLTIPGTGEDASLTGDLDLVGPLFIEGEDPATTIIDGGGLDTVLHVQVIDGVSLWRLTIRNGNGPGVAGGVVATYSSGPFTSGFLGLTDMIVRDNTGGGIQYRGGGNGGLLVDRTRVTGNSSYVRAPGIDVELVGGGWPSSFTLDRSTVDDNEFLFPFSPGVAVSVSATSLDAGVAVTNSTISGNHGSSMAGSTCSGIMVSDGSGTAAELWINNSTIADNDGYGIWIGQVFGGLGVTRSMRNSIVADNGLANCQFLKLDSYGYNIDSNLNDCFVPVAGDLTDTDPLLGPLQDNGGHTPTRALLAGSPARDAANPGLPGAGGDTCEGGDQRDVPRPQFGRCDIGAYEVGIEFGIGSFKCYKAKDLKAPKFLPTVVALSDQFGVDDGATEVQKPALLCTPASVNGGDITNPADHLACYKIKRPGIAPATRPRVEAVIGKYGAFGALQLEAKKAALLCVPSAKTVLP